LFVRGEKASSKLYKIILQHRKILAESNSTLGRNRRVRIGVCDNPFLVEGKVLAEKIWAGLYCREEIEGGNDAIAGSDIGLANGGIAETQDVFEVVLADVSVYPQGMSYVRTYLESGHHKIDTAVGNIRTAILYAQSGSETSTRRERCVRSNERQITDEEA
jgi:hypothetical protein